MKLAHMLIGFMLLSSAWIRAQEVTLQDEQVPFSSGSYQSIVTVIPYANRATVAKQLKSELKDWGGKLTITGDEYHVVQGKLKALGDKPVDGYARIIESADGIKVAFAVDLGGAFVNASEHPAEYRVIHDRVWDFGSQSASRGITATVSADKKALKSLEKEERDIERSIERANKDIADYQKKIRESEKEIEAKKAELSAKQEEIKNQNLQLSGNRKKAKKLK